MDIEWDEENPPRVGEWAEFIAASTQAARLAAEMGERGTALHILKQIRAVLTPTAELTDPPDPEIETVKEGRDPR